MLNLPHCPTTGGGVHRWLLGAANLIARSGVSPSAAVEILAAESRTCGRRVPPREIESAVAKAFAESRSSARPRYLNSQPAAWPRPIQSRIDAITSTGFGAVELWEASPVRLTGDGPDAEELVDLLFPGNPLLCCGSGSDRFDTKPREDWRGQLGELALIVPSPMSALTGRTQDGKESARSNSNTGPRRYLVVEFDQGSFDDHAARLAHLAGMAPLAVVVHSGNKSLHGWFACRSATEQKQHAFMRYAVCIGADPATWTRSQMVRLPEGQRENGVPQRVMYLNEKVMETC